MLTGARYLSEHYSSLPVNSTFLLTIHSFLKLLARSHLTRLHKVATWWIFQRNYVKAR
ncbi:hypothetical protein HMPREF0880_02955 [Yokenella regensburgei ATCC 43003]|nr:hypothetical protein HMPREF0880_02955 [Yokenella regensburgei ATCC 43003]